MSKNYYTHISADHKLWDLKLREVWAYREMIWMFTKRNFTVSFKQTILGPAWLFINPLFTSLVYVVLFGNIAKLGTDGLPQLLFYFTSTAIWTFFSNSLLGNSGIFSGNAYLFGKVYFPRLCMPLSNVLSTLIRFGIQMIVVFILLCIYVPQGLVKPHWWALILIPLVLAWLAVLGMGLGLIASSITAKYRDLGSVISFGVSMLHYATPIVYPMSTIVAFAYSATGWSWVRVLLMLNPISMPVEIFRYALLGVGTIEMPYVFISLVLTLIIGFFSIVLFNKVERNFMDTV